MSNISSAWTNMHSDQTEGFKNWFKDEKNITMTFNNPNTGVPLSDLKAECNVKLITDSKKDNNIKEISITSQLENTKNKKEILKLNSKDTIEYESNKKLM